MQSVHRSADPHMGAMGYFGEPTTQTSLQPDEKMSARNRVKGTPARRCFTPEALAAFEAMFKTVPQPTELQLKELAGAFNEEFTRVKVWFNNRRAKDRKNQDPFLRGSAFAPDLDSFNHLLATAGGGGDPYYIGSTFHKLQAQSGAIVDLDNLPDVITPEMAQVMRDRIFELEAIAAAVKRGTTKRGRPSDGSRSKRRKTIKNPRTILRRIMNRLRTTLKTQKFAQAGWEGMKEVKVDDQLFPEEFDMIFSQKGAPISQGDTTKPKNNIVMREYDLNAMKDVFGDDFMGEGLKATLYAKAKGTTAVKAHKIKNAPTQVNGMSVTYNSKTHRLTMRFQAYITIDPTQALLPASLVGLPLGGHTGQWDQPHGLGQ